MERKELDEATEALLRRQAKDSLAEDVAAFKRILAGLAIGAGWLAGLAIVGLLLVGVFLLVVKAFKWAWYF